MVILVDPDDPTKLQRKAPHLWALAHGTGVYFQHESASGVDFLDELRRRFSRYFLNNLLADSILTYAALTGNQNPTHTSFAATVATRDLYGLRRDASGVAEGYVTRLRVHQPVMQTFGAMHILLLENGATLAGSKYVFNGKTIRLLHAAGQALSLVKSNFEHEPQPQIVDYIVICVGATNDGNIIANIVRGQAPQTIVRPGLVGDWLTEVEARLVLGI